MLCLKLLINTPEQLEKRSILLRCIMSAAMAISISKWFHRTFMIFAIVCIFSHWPPFKLASTALTAFGLKLAVRRKTLLNLLTTFGQGHVCYALWHVDHAAAWHFCLIELMQQKKAANKIENSASASCQNQQASFTLSQLGVEPSVMCYNIKCGCLFNVTSAASTYPSCTTCCCCFCRCCKYCQGVSSQVNLGRPFLQTCLTAWNAVVDCV